MKSPGEWLYHRLCDSETTDRARGYNAMNPGVKEDWERLGAEIQRDLFDAVQEAERLRSALRAATHRMMNAHGQLTVGMKAGVSDARALLQLGLSEANDAIQQAYRVPALPPTEAPE